MVKKLNEGGKLFIKYWGEKNNGDVIDKNYFSEGNGENLYYRIWGRKSNEGENYLSNFLKKRTMVMLGKFFFWMDYRSVFFFKLDVYYLFKSVCVFRLSFGNKVAKLPKAFRNTLTRIGGAPYIQRFLHKTSLYIHSTP